MTKNPYRPMADSVHCVRHSARLRWLIAIGLAVTLLSPLNSKAQTLQDVRQENQRLKDQIRDLTAQLKSANERITELLERINKLESTISTTTATEDDPESSDQPSDAPDQQPSVTTNTQEQSHEDAWDESTLKAAGAQSCPTALLYALRESYKKDLGERPIGEPGSKTNLSYLRAVRLWLRQVNHAYRAHVSWIVRIENREELGRRTEVKIQPVTEDGLTSLGDPFWIRLSPSQDGRLITIVNRSNSDLIHLEGALIPAAQFDHQVTPEIATSQTAIHYPERPPVIGPYVSFYYFFQATRIRPLSPFIETPETPETPEVSEETPEAPTENNAPTSSS